MRLLAVRAFVLALLLHAAAVAQETVAPSFDEPPADGIEIVVVAADTQAVLAGATVAFVDISGLSGHEVEARLATAFTPGTREPGVLWLRADGAGRTRVPHTLERSALRATHGDRAGSRTIDCWSTGEHEPLPVRAEVVVSQQVLVVDTAGAPRAGVPVAISVKQGAGRSRISSAPTGPDGVARFEGLQWVFRPQAEVLEAFAELGFLTLRAGNPGVRLKKITAEPLKLVLPDTGSLRVRVRGPKGAPLTGPVHVELSLLPLRDDGPTPSDDRPLTLDAEGVGTAHFPFVGLRTRFRVSAYPGRSSGYDGSTPHVVSREVKGPERVGQAIEVELEFPSFEPAAAAPQFLLPFVVEGERLVTGLVLDGAGRPAVGAVVAYREHTLPEENAPLGVPRRDWVASTFVPEARTDGSGRFELFLANHGAGEPTWQVLAAGARPVDWHVIANLDGHVPAAPVPFERGQDLKIRLEKEALVIGRLLLDPGVDPRSYEVRLAYEEPDERLSWLDARTEMAGEGPGSAQYGLGGRFRWRGLAAGRVRVTVSGAGGAGTLYELDGLEVGAGAVVVDPRLAAIDLRASAERAR